MKDADLDGDGAISREEFQKLDRLARIPEEKREALFKRLDKDGDEFLKPGELNGMRPDRKRPPMPDLKQLDTNKDGGVDFAEFTASPFVKRVPPKHQRGFFDRLDRDSDGKITPADRPGRERGRGANHGPPPGPPLDTDGDGTVSFEEFRASPGMARLGEDIQEDRFELLDKNGDLKLDQDELQRGRKPRPK